MSDPKADTHSEHGTSEHGTHSEEDNKWMPSNDFLTEYGFKPVPPMIPFTTPRDGIKIKNPLSEELGHSLPEDFSDVFRYEESSVLRLDAFHRYVNANEINRVPISSLTDKQLKMLRKVHFYEGQISEATIKLFNQIFDPRCGWVIDVHPFIPKFMVYFPEPISNEHISYISIDYHPEYNGFSMIFYNTKNEDRYFTMLTDFGFGDITENYIIDAIMYAVSVFQNDPSIMEE